MSHILDESASYDLRFRRGILRDVSGGFVDIVSCNQHIEMCRRLVVNPRSNLIRARRICDVSSHNDGC